MKTARKKYLFVLVALLLLVGCKAEKPPTVNLGYFEVAMPGTVVQDSQQLPLTQMGLGVNTPLVMTTAQSTPDTNEVYIVISVEWEQTLAALSQKSGQQWDEHAFTGVVEQSILELLTVGASVEEEKAVSYSGLEGVAVPFTIQQTVMEGSDDWAQTKGEAVSFVSRKRLIMLVYMAEQSAYSAGNKESFFSSIVVHDQ